MSLRKIELTGEDVKSIAKMLELTRDLEFNCEDCQRHLGELAERQVAGSPSDDLLEKVEHHLQLCPECHEECEALLAILRLS